jgi:hypothetical protein
MSMVVLAAFGFSAKAILVKIAYQWQPGLDPIVLGVRFGAELCAVHHGQW